MMKPEAIKRLSLLPRPAWVLCCVAVLGGCRIASQRAIPLTSEAAAPAGETNGRDALIVAIAPVISPQETLSAYGDLVDVLGRLLDRHAEVVQRSTYAETNQLIRDGLCDLAFVCSMAYVRGRDEFGMEALVVPQVRGKTTYRSYIIVPEDSPAQRLADLRGHSFAFVDPLSNTGWLVPVAMLHRLGADPDSFFSSTIFTHSHDNSIRAVADHLVDGAAVDSLVYEYLSARRHGTKGTRIIERSPAYGIPPVVTPPRLPREERNRLRSAFLRLHVDEQGRDVLARLMIDRFVLPERANYTSIIEMLNAEWNAP